MGTIKSWNVRRQKYGPSGVKNKELKKQRQTIAQLRRHALNGGHSEVTKEKIGKANAIALEGKFYPNSSHFKQGPNHQDWQGGKHVYFHKLARKIMMKAGFSTEGFHVHHKNHDFTDNSLENLILISPKEHGRLHALKRRGEFI